MASSDRPTVVSKPFPRKASTRGALRWGVIVRKGDNTPYMLSLYYQPDKRKWRTSYASIGSDKVRDHGATLKLSIVVPEGQNPDDADYLASLLSDAEKARVLALSIEKSHR